MTIADRFPAITPVSWLKARDVLGGEASDFTPWLSVPASLEALGEALRLEDLTAVAQEHNVLGKRLDILASATDENGEELPVCIENQYGISDPDHLGRLIAYLAQQERGRAVWVVEEAHEAFISAVRFLNRTSSDEVGYYLVQVRFTHGASGGYQVYFDVLAAPIAWERPSRRRAVRSTPVNATKVEWMRALREAMEPDLLGAGFVSVGLHHRGSYLWARWPQDVWLRPFAQRLLVRATLRDWQVIVFSRNLNSREANSAAITIMEEVYSGELERGKPADTAIAWRAADPGVTEQVRAVRTGVSYRDGDVDEAAAWANSLAQLWLRLLRDKPISDMAQRVAGTLPGAALAAREDSLDEDT